jgi:hypothetical protein
LGQLVGKSSGYVESLPGAVKKRVSALHHLQKKHLDLEKEFEREVAALERKYQTLYAPLYTRVIFLYPCVRVSYWIACGYCKGIGRAKR